MTLKDSLKAWWTAHVIADAPEELTAIINTTWRISAEPLPPLAIAPVAESPQPAPEMKIMSWFTSDIEHPAIAALEGLLANPAITASPEAIAAVQSAQATAATVASTVTAASTTVAAAASAAADPIVKDLETGLQGVMDSVLTQYLGPVGGTVLTPPLNAGLALLESYAHTYLAGLFSTAKTSAAPAK